MFFCDLLGFLSGMVPRVSSRRVLVPKAFQNGVHMGCPNEVFGANLYRFDCDDLYEYTFRKHNIYNIRCEFDVHACFAVSSRPTRSQSNMLLEIANVYHCCFRSVGSVPETVRNMAFVAQARGENLRWMPPP